MPPDASDVPPTGERAADQVERPVRDYFDPFRPPADTAVEPDPPLGPGPSQLPEAAARSGDSLANSPAWPVDSTLA